MRTKVRCNFLTMLLVALVACGGESSTPDRKSQGKIDSENMPDRFGAFARAFNWKLVPAVSPDQTACGALFNALSLPASLAEIEPIVESNSKDNPGFRRFKQCRAIREKFAQADVADRPEDFASLGAFGDRGFRLYSILPTDTTNQVSTRTWDIVYGEFSAENMGANVNVDGYSSVEFANCRVVGNVRIQRKKPSDLPGTPRDIIHGMFSVRGRAWLLVASEEVGKEYDPYAYKAITAYRLQSNGELIPACSWYPTEIASQSL